MGWEDYGVQKAATVQAHQDTEAAESKKAEARIMTNPLLDAQVKYLTVAYGSLFSRRNIARLFWEIIKKEMARPQKGAQK